jgi:hypothetical protein
VSDDYEYNRIVMRDYANAIDELRLRVEKAEKERNDAQPELVEARQERDCLRELLAVLNGDGGHRAQEVGYERAAEEAQARWYKMVSDLDLAESQNSG